METRSPCARPGTDVAPRLPYSLFLALFLRLSSCFFPPLSGVVACRVTMAGVKAHETARARSDTRPLRPALDRDIPKIKRKMGV